MTLYSSKTPHDLMIAGSFRDFADYPQRNNPNPFLIAARRAIKEGANLRDVADDLLGYEIGYPGCAHIDHAFDAGYRKSAPDHARRVLTRLAALGEVAMSNPVIFASTPATASALDKGPGKYLAAGSGWGRTHEANPILVAVRERSSDPQNSAWSVAQDALSALAMYGPAQMQRLVAMHGIRGTVTPDHMAHASRVLTRFVKLTEGTNA